ncbi:MAG: hypothetical protein ABMA64_42445, partial [Myxococcota bacterium]
MWAILSYGSFFFGIPLGIVPIVQRDDPYALRHAKTATAVWLISMGLGVVLFMVYLGISFATCGMGSLFVFPMLVLPVPWVMTVAIHGLVITMNGQWDEPMGGFGLGEALFSSVTPKAPPLLDAAPPADGLLRRAGGGRRSVATTDPGVIPELERLVAPATLGDPMRPLLWVSKSMDKLAAALTAKGHPISGDTVARELVKLGYSRQHNR